MNFLGPEQFGNHSSFAVMLFTLILTIDLVDYLTHSALRSVCASCVSLLFTKMLDLNFFSTAIFLSSLDSDCCVKNKVHSLQT